MEREISISKSQSQSEQQPTRTNADRAVKISRRGFLNGAITAAGLAITGVGIGDGVRRGINIELTKNKDSKAAQDLNEQSLPWVIGDIVATLSGTTATMVGLGRHLVEEEELRTKFKNSK